MEIGCVVKACAGRDKGGYFVVLGFDGEYAMICDGKRRPVENPKKKKYKHLSATKTVLESCEMKTNRGVRKALSKFNGV